MIFNTGEKVYFSEKVDQWDKIPLFEEFEVIISNVANPNKGFYIEFEGEEVYIASYEFKMVRKVGKQ